MNTIRKKYSIKASPDLVYELLTNASAIEKWSGSPAEMNDSTGSAFSLWDGSIHGINREISRTRIVQDWKEKGWKNYSKVTMILGAAEGGNQSFIDLIHEKIPDDSLQSINDGWDEYYFGPLINLAEKGS